MTHEELIKMRKRFCTLYKIPNNMLADPYFMDRIKLYGKEKEYMAFQDKVMELGMPGFEALYVSIKEAAIDAIKSTDGYQKLNEDDMNKYAVPKMEFRTKDIYSDAFVGHDIISLDLKSANFNVLRCYDPGIFNGKENWEDFLGRFTNDEMFLNSKYMRQVILGSCNPRRQTTYERYMLFKIVKPFMEKLSKYLVAFMNDELIFDITELDDKKEKAELMETLLKLQNNAKIPMRMEQYKLLKVHGVYGYIKLLSNKTWEIKSCRDIHYPIIYRVMSGKKIQDSDLYFWADGLLAKLVDANKITITDVA